MRGICVTAVTKAVCGHPSIARAMLDGGATGLAEPRLSNVIRLRQAGMTCPVTLIRTPMLSQVDDVVRVCDSSYNTELFVIKALAAAALKQNKVHGIILMVEMGDRREGIMPHSLGEIAQQVLAIPGVALQGIGANFACLSNIAPTTQQMRDLSALATDVEGQCGPFLRIVSGGNSANLPWALEQSATGRINDLRIGEAILLGVDPITGEHIGGMFRDAFTLVAEVIETNTKPMHPPTQLSDTSVAKVHLVPDTSKATRIILGIGHQDIDVAGLSMPRGNTFIGATSDHLIVGTHDATLCAGSEMRFQMNYSALMRAMAAPDTRTNLCSDHSAPNKRDAQGPNDHLALV